MRDFLLLAIFEYLNFFGLEIRDDSTVLVGDDGIHLNQIRRDAHDIFRFRLLRTFLRSRRRSGGWTGSWLLREHVTRQTKNQRGRNQKMAVHVA